MHKYIYNVCMICNTYFNVDERIIIIIIMIKIIIKIIITNRFTVGGLTS